MGIQLVNIKTIARELRIPVYTVMRHVIQKGYRISIDINNDYYIKVKTNTRELLR